MRERPLDVTLRLDPARPWSRERRHRFRRLIKGIHGREAILAREPEYQREFQLGFPNLGCTDGLDLWDSPRLQAQAPLLIVMEHDVSKELVEGERELLRSFGEELLKGIIEE